MSQRNLGKAQVKVEISDTIHEIRMKPDIYSMDASAAAFETYLLSPKIPPLLPAYITDESQNFAAVFPSPRKFMIPNYLYNDGRVPTSTATTATTTTTTTATTTASDKYITWKPIPSELSATNTTMTIPGMIKDTQSKWGDYKLEMPIAGVKYSETYKGPQWDKTNLYYEAVPDDDAIIKQYFALMSSAISESDSSQTPSSLSTITSLPSIDAVVQTVPADGLWWGAESSAFLGENYPFWVVIRKPEAAVSSKDHPAFLLISMGAKEQFGGNRIDILLPFNSNPMIIDYNNVDPKDTKKQTPSTYTCQDESANISSSTKYIEVGVMTIAGRLVVFVNGKQMIYTRINKGTKSTTSSTSPTGTVTSTTTTVAEGSMAEVKIPSGVIRVYGGNVSVTFCAAPMVFARLCIVALPFKGTYVDKQGTKKDLYFESVDYQALPSGNPVCILPQPPSITDKLYGVDSYEFHQYLISSTTGGVYESIVNPSGFGFHKRGRVWFARARDTNINFSHLPDVDFYLIAMKPSNIDFPSVSGTKIPYGGCPYFYQIRGICQTVYDKQTGTFVDISDDVISVSETVGGDYQHVKRNGSVTLYNENGKYDYFKTKQKCIRLSWKWENVLASDSSENELTATLLGVTISASISQSPGKETITVNFEDYMYLLNQLRIINSPIYDGMVYAYAVKDIARRAGIPPANIIYSWNNIDDYFLPSGYAFTKPLIRFPPMNSLFECAMQLTQRSDCYIYFDAEGKFHIDHKPGGLWGYDSNASPAPTTIDFSTSPSPTSDNIILGELNYDASLNETVNVISAVSLERDTRNIILYNLPATTAQDRLIIRKPYFFEQPQWGSLKALKGIVHLLSERMFKSTKKLTFKTIGSSSTLTLLPLQYVKVNGELFRVVGIKRNYNAELNDFTQEIETKFIGS